MFKKISNVRINLNNVLDVVKKFVFYGYICVYIYIYFFFFFI